MELPFVTIHNPAVYFSGARIRMSPTLVPRLSTVCSNVMPMEVNDYLMQFKEAFEQQRHNNTVGKQPLTLTLLTKIVNLTHVNA